MTIAVKVTTTGWFGRCTECKERTLLPRSKRVQAQKDADIFFKEHVCKEEDQTIMANPASTKAKAKPKAKPAASKPKATKVKATKPKTTDKPKDTRPTGAGTNQNRRTRDEKGFQGSGGNPDKPQIHPRVKSSTLKKLALFAKKNGMKPNEAVGILLDRALKSPPKA